MDVTAAALCSGMELTIGLMHQEPHAALGTIAYDRRGRCPGLRTESALDVRERSTAEVGAAGASQELGYCKHQSISHPAAGRPAGIGQMELRGRVCSGDDRR